MAVFAIGNPALLVVVFLLLVAVSGAIWLARVSSRTLESLNRKATNHRPGVRVDLKTRISEPEPKVVGVIDQRSWIPNVLPEPLSNRLGQLRQHAPVVSFEQVKTDSLRQKTEEAVEPQNPTEINVTEILKRRRVI
jgi:hypothetical protein